jgi:hypothetical protein
MIYLLSLEWAMVARHLSGGLMILVLIGAVGGCVTTPELLPRQMRLESLFAEDFKGYQLPEPARVKQDGFSREYVQTSFDEVWNSAILVLIQRGIIVRASKDAGIIVRFDRLPRLMFAKEVTESYFLLAAGLPWVVLIEERGPQQVVVYAGWLEELYQSVDQPEMPLIRITSPTKKRLADVFFDLLAVQNFGKQQWQYLFE